MGRAAVLRKKARKEPRKKGKPIPPMLAKGLLRDIVARKKDAMVILAVGTTVHAEERKERDSKPKSETEVKEQMKDPKIRIATRARKQARRELRAHGESIPKVLKKGVMRGVIAKEPEAIAVVKKEAQKTESSAPDDKTPEQHDKEMQNEITQNNRKATDPDGPEMHDKRMNEEMKHVESHKVHEYETKVRKQIGPIRKQIPRDHYVPSKTKSGHHPGLTPEERKKSNDALTNAVAELQGKAKGEPSK